MCLQVLLAGNNKTNTDALNKCDVNGISSPDNLFYMNGNLLIAEDTTSHFNNILWAYNLKTGEWLSPMCLKQKPYATQVFWQQLALQRCISVIKAPCMLPLCSPSMTYPSVSREQQLITSC
jgi:hypothetical protein